MKHKLSLTKLTGDWAEFTAYHQLVPFPESGHRPGTEPFGPFRVQLATAMHMEDWEKAGRPVDLEVDL